MSTSGVPLAGNNPHDDRFEIRNLLHDDFIWRRRNLGLVSIYAFAPRAWRRETINTNLIRRGWLFGKGHSDNPVTAAPCRTCNRKRVPVEHLNEKRECRECRRAKGWAA